MRTNPYLNFFEWTMKDDYSEASQPERSFCFSIPLDFGCIDAPTQSPAGSTYSHEYITMRGHYTDMPTAISIR